MRAAAAARRALPFAVLAVVLWLARRVDWAATLATLRSASPGLVALAVAAEVVSVAAKALRWWLFLRPLGARGPGLALRATFAGAGVNNLVVANGGEAARVVLVSRALGAPSARVLATIALDRAWEAVGYGALLVLAAVVAPLPPALARFRPAALACAALLAAGLAALVWWPGPAGRPADPGEAEAYVGEPGTALARLAAHPRHFLHALGELSTLRRSAAAFVLSMVVWGTQLATYAAAAAAARAPLSLAGNLATLLTVNLAFAVRVTPGGVGVFQALYALAARPFGIGGPAAVAAAILIQAVQILPITAIGAAAALPELRRRRRALPASDQR